MALAKHLVLASNSQTRQSLLASAGLSFLCEAAGIDEHAITADDPDTCARQRGLAKAHAVAARRPLCLVLGADQTLALGRQSFTKAHNPEEARQTLLQLAGRTHHLYSAFCLVYNDGTTIHTLSDHCVPVAMPMRALSSAEISAYLAHDEWQGAVGCYQFENVGVNLFDFAVLPDASAVLGLPLAPLLADLRRLGVNPLTAGPTPWQLNLAIPPHHS